MWLHNSMPLPDDASGTLVLLLSLLASPASAMLHCDKIVTNDRHFDLSPLFKDGPRSVTISQQSGASLLNTTYTTDLCRPLRRSHDVPLDEQCKNGARVCAIEHAIGTGEKAREDMVIDVINIAGQLSDHGGGKLDEELINLSTSDSNADAEREGVRIILKGGFHYDNANNKRQQRAVIEFVCDPEREGFEGEYKGEDQYERSDDPLRFRSVEDFSLFDAAEDEGEGEGGDGEGDGEEKPQEPIQLGGGKNASLVFNSYGPLEKESNVDVLRLTWRTKYACENRRDDGDDGEGTTSSHWGFFTWLVILIFLGTSAYLIFGSWLNYNRYGARGWDLLPHGDTLRDIPYLLKDWARRVLNTVQGSGSRGGYSAV